MTQYDNTNRGVLFDNDRKESDSHPDMKGKLNINGVDHWFSAWWKESRDGAEFLSLSLGKQCEQQAKAAPEQNAQAPGPERRGNRPSNRPSGEMLPASRPAQKPVPAGGFDDMDDDVPF